MEEANGPTTCLVVAACQLASQGDGEGRGICMGDGQTEAPGVSAESGRSDALLQHMLPYLTWLCLDGFEGRKVAVETRILYKFLLITSSLFFACLGSF